MTQAEITPILVEYVVSAIPNAVEINNLEHAPLREILDSISMIRFMAFIEERFDLIIASADVTPEQFSNLFSVSQLISRKLRS